MSLKHAILGFLSVRPLSGYDLKRAFDESVGHFWTADQAQIYRTLARLVDDGLVEAEHVEQQGRPDRKDHRLTEAGRAELDGWLASPHEPPPTREPFLLRVFFVGRLGREAVRTLLAERVAEAERQLEALRGVAEAVARELGGAGVDLEQRLRLATLDNGLRHTEAERDWAARLLERLDRSDGFDDAKAEEAPS